MEAPVVIHQHFAAPEGGVHDHHTHRRLEFIVRFLEKIMSELTRYADQLRAANAQLDAQGQGLTNIGKDVAKLVQLAIAAETPEEIAAVDAEFATLNEKLGKFGTDVAAIDAMYETEPDAPPVDPNAPPV